jgi:hypothetical protein
MQRDLSLVRTILLATEALKPGSFHSQGSKALEGVEARALLEHVRLLLEAGLVGGHMTLDDGRPSGGTFAIDRLTWKGHELLALLRDPGIWAQTQERLSVLGGSAPLELLTAIARELVEERLGLHRR